MPTLRLVSTDARSFRRDRAGLSAAIAAAAPDVAIVHGSPHLGRWRSLSAEIARKAGLVVVGGGRVAGANLILCSLGVDFVDATDVLFSANPARPAGVGVAQLRRAGVRFVVAAGGLGAAAPGTDAASLRHALSAHRPDPLVLGVASGALQFADLGRVIEDRLVVSSSIEVASADFRTGVLIAELRLPG